MKIYLLYFVVKTRNEVKLSCFNSIKTFGAEELFIKEKVGKFRQQLFYISINGKDNDISANKVLFPEITIICHIYFKIIILK